ncbi:MAG: DUF503 domain-containing protein [Gammaproteobacteria bacterium]|nr:DUF503 domain-containing protein [Gammaproteobacteria bacterium]
MTDPVAKACLLRIDLHFGGCRSLKEKRQRLKGIGARLGQVANVAVCESAYQDSHQRSQWSIVAVAADAVVVEKTLTEAERRLEQAIDAQLIGAEREWLC